MNELSQNHSASEDDHSQLYSITAMRGLGQAPKVRVRVQGQNGSAELSVLPDSGADISATDLSIVSELGEHLENLLPSDRSQAYSVDGSVLRPIG